MISQAPVSSKPISIIREAVTKVIYYFVNDCRTVYVAEESRELLIKEEIRTVEVKC